MFSFRVQFTVTEVTVTFTSTTCVGKREVLALVWRISLVNITDLGDCVMGCRPLCGVLYSITG